MIRAVISGNARRFETDVRELARVLSDSLGQSSIEQRLTSMHIELISSNVAQTAMLRQMEQLSSTVSELVQTNTRLAHRNEELEGLLKAHD